MAPEELAETLARRIAEDLAPVLFAWLKDLESRER